MRRAFLPCAVAVAALGAVAAAPAGAQVPPGCPPGYYLATDGQCYPGEPPDYVPPVYDVAPPIIQPPFVIDGFIPGIGYGRHDERGHGGAPHGGRGPGGGQHR